MSVSYLNQTIKDKMSEEAKPNDTTVVKEVEMDINDILGIPGADNVMLATPKDTVFTKKEKDTFLDNPENQDNDEVKLDENGKAIPATKAEATTVLDTLVNLDADSSAKDDGDDGDGTKTAGRQKVD
jgi:hypothetical protein